MAGFADLLEGGADFATDLLDVALPGQPGQIVDDIFGIGDDGGGAMDVLPADVLIDVGAPAVGFCAAAVGSLVAAVLNSPNARSIARQIAEAVGFLRPEQHSYTCEVFEELLAREDPTLYNTVRAWNCGAPAPLMLGERGEMYWAAFTLVQSGRQLPKL